MTDLSYTNKDGLNLYEGFDNGFNYHKDGKQDGDGYEHGGYPEITGETSEYTDTSYKTGDNPDFFGNGNVWEQISPEPAKEIESIEITTPPTKTEYTVGEALDLTGMVVTATYTDGTDGEITDYTTDPAAGTILTVEDTWFDVICGEYSDSCSITVTAPVVLESVEIYTPQNMELETGSTFSDHDFALTATYSDESKKIIAQNFTGLETGRTYTPEEFEEITSYIAEGIEEILAVDSITFSPYAVGDVVFDHDPIQEEPGYVTQTATYEGKSANFTINWEDGEK